jgi:hypothetical protein
MITPKSGPHGDPARVPTWSPAAGAPPRRGPLSWFARGGWYLFVVVLSLGILSFVPFVHAATRLRRPLAWLWAVLYTSAVVALFLVPSTPSVGGFMIGLMIVASVHSVVLRQQVWPASALPQPVPVGPAGSHPAVAAALAARARREEARGLAAADPRMARDLRIGRPDLPRAYDDGGLVDLNSAPPSVIADVCEIELAVATLIADARAPLPFTTIDDVFSLVDIPYPLWDRIRDRAIVIAG